MAKVFVADDAIVGRRVVVKVLAPELAAGVNLERFHREIQVAGMLHHPGIVPVLSAGQTDDILYYTMPYIEGDSLRALIEREQQLSVERALEIARDVTDALEHAHAHNIVHRDIKPDNILIESATGRAVVTDFGIARAIEKAADISSVTSTGLTLGTPTYMSPEQAGAEKHVDGRSDIYSLGCVLYEMLAGMPPFTGSTARSIIARHMTEPPPPIRVVRPDLPEGVVRLIDRMLAKVPSGRFANATKLAVALEKPELVTEPGWREASRPRSWWFAAIGIPALLIGGLLFARSRQGPPASVGPHDRTRVAVLYFDAPRGDSVLLDVGRAITSDLISSLRTADITVISEPGIAHFSPTAAPQEIARTLNVGTLVYGRLESSGRGDSLRVRVRLVDAGAVELESFDVYSGRATTLALRDAVVQRVAQRLVVPLGHEVQLKRWRAGTASESAWLLQARAENLLMRGRDADLAGTRGDARSAYDAA